MNAKWAVGLLGAIVYGLGVVAVMRAPSRGLQDRIAGTWLVPK